MRTGRSLKTTTSASRRRFATASLVALATAIATAAALPPPVFRAAAIVAIDDPSAAMRLASARSAADLAVSKPVIMRAAASLNGTIVQAPGPALPEMIGVAAGLAGPSGAVARLADTLTPALSARAGEGFVEIQATAADPARAARAATALAEALVVEGDNVVAAASRRREASSSSRLDTLRESVRASHARLAALGAPDIDPAEALAAAAAAARAAEARVAAVHAVIAAGTPPLGAGTELPPSAASLQQVYWDLKKQLDKASETMGERHTTVIALRDGVARAAANLTAEWQRIEHAATNDLATTRSREAVLRKAVSSIDPAKRAAIDEARGTARSADAALAHALAPAVSPVGGSTFRLVAPASVPAVASGLALAQRVSIVGGAGATGLALALLVMGRRRRDETSIAAASEPVVPSARDIGGKDRDQAASAPIREVQTDPAPVTAVEPAVPRPDEEFDTNYFDSEWLDFEPVTPIDERIDAMPFETASFDADPLLSTAPLRTKRPAIDRDLRDALRAIAADLPVTGPASSMPATVMVAANAAGADTGTVALALGEAAVELGLRVLVIESDRVRPALAEAVSSEIDPVLVDVFGALRVALPAEGHEGLFLAPAFRERARIAAALARNTRTELIDDLAAAFDAVVIDGGRATDAAADGWTAELLIRVGRFASQRDDSHFLETLDAPSEALLGTIAAGRFVARETAPEPRPVARPVLRSVPVSPEVVRRRPEPVPSLRMPPRRRVATR